MMKHWKMVNKMSCAKCGGIVNLESVELMSSRGKVKKYDIISFCDQCGSKYVQKMKKIGKQQVFY